MAQLLALLLLSLSSLANGVRTETEEDYFGNMTALNQNLTLYGAGALGLPVGTCVMIEGFGPAKIVIDCFDLKAKFEAGKLQRDEQRNHKKCTFFSALCKTQTNPNGMCPYGIQYPDDTTTYNIPESTIVKAFAASEVNPSTCEVKMASVISGSQLLTQKSQKITSQQAYIPGGMSMQIAIDTTDVIVPVGTSVKFDMDAQIGDGSIYLPPGTSVKQSTKVQSVIVPQSLSVKTGSQKPPSQSQYMPTHGSVKSQRTNSPVTMAPHSIYVPPGTSVKTDPRAQQVIVPPALSISQIPSGRQVVQDGTDQLIVQQGMQVVQSQRAGSTVIVPPGTQVKIGSKIDGLPMGTSVKTQTKSQKTGKSAAGMCDGSICCTCNANQNFNSKRKPVVWSCTGVCSQCQYTFKTAKVGDFAAPAGCQSGEVSRTDPQGHANCHMACGF